MPDRTTIYVYLKDEGVDVWRPVEAIPLDDGIYRIVSGNTEPETEAWEFSKGDLVRCELKTLHSVAPRACLVAVERIQRSD